MKYKPAPACVLYRSRHYFGPYQQRSRKVGNQRRCTKCGQVQIAAWKKKTKKDGRYFPADLGDLVWRWP